MNIEREGNKYAVGTLFRKKSRKIKECYLVTILHDSGYAGNVQGNNKN